MYGMLLAPVQCARAGDLPSTLNETGPTAVTIFMWCATHPGKTLTKMPRWQQNICILGLLKKMDNVGLLCTNHCSISLYAHGWTFSVYYTLDRCTYFRFKKNTNSANAVNTNSSIFWTLFIAKEVFSTRSCGHKAHGSSYRRMCNPTDGMVHII
jgi:hypothetical protein